MKLLVEHHKLADLVAVTTVKLDDETFIDVLMLRDGIDALIESQGIAAAPPSTTPPLVMPSYTIQPKQSYEPPAVATDAPVADTTVDLDAIDYDADVPDDEALAEMQARIEAGQGIVPVSMGDPNFDEQRESRILSDRHVG